MKKIFFILLLFVCLGTSALAQRINTNEIKVRQRTSTPACSTGSGTIWFDDSTNVFRACQNGGAAFDLVGAGSGDALVANPLSQFASTTSAQLASTISNETGAASGSPLLVFNQAPAISAPVLTAPTVTTSIVPTSDDGAALGSTSNKFSDLWLASGGVINFNSGDVTVTHGANVITIGGGDLALGANNITITGSIGATGARSTKGWFTDLEVTNAIAGGVTGNAGTATILANARTIGGVSFNGSANITVASATGGFTVSGGDLAIGANNLTVTGSIGATGARSTKGWFTDLEVTNAIAGGVTGNAGTATVLANARTIGGVSFNGSANITVASATGGFAVSGGDLDIASGGVIDFNAGDVTVTHSANTLTVVGGSVVVPTEVYDATGWDNNMSVPTKDAVRDKIEALALGGSVTVGSTSISSGTATRLLYEAAGNVLGEVSGVTSDGTNVTAGSGNLRATSPRIITSILDTNGATVAAITATASAVNYPTFVSGAAASGIAINATGSDTDIDFSIGAKGGGSVILNGIIELNPSSTEAAAISFFEGTAPSAAAANSIQLQAPADVTTAYDLILPAASTTGFLLNTNSSNVGTLSIVGFTGTGNVARVTDAVFGTSLQIPNGTAPTTDAAGEIAFDTNIWASGRGSLQIWDGTAITHAVNVLASDAPSNGQVPKWNTGGTITWEDDGGGGSVATDAIFDAAGDLVQGTGANTSAKLTIGATDAILNVTGGSAAWRTYVTTKEVNLNTNILPDSSGSVFYEPAGIKATNDVLVPGNWIFNDTGTDLSIFGVTRVPPDYVGTGAFVVDWSTTATSGDTIWRISYSCVAAGESLDPAAVQESVTSSAATAGGTTNFRVATSVSFTSANCVAGDTMLWKLIRLGTSGSDTLAAATRVYNFTLSYKDK